MNRPTFVVRSSASRGEITFGRQLEFTHCGECKGVREKIVADNKAAKWALYLVIRLNTLKPV